MPRLLPLVLLVLRLAAPARAAFGAQPPAHARLAVMNDSEGAHGAALAFVDHPEVGP